MTPWVTRHYLIWSQSYRTVDFPDIANGLRSLNVIRSKFQNLTDPHAPTGHQFKHQSIADFGGAENDLIDGIFFDDFPSGYHPFPIKLQDHGRVTGIH